MAKKWLAVTSVHPQLKFAADFIADVGKKLKTEPKGRDRQAAALRAVKLAIKMLSPRPPARSAGRAGALRMDPCPTGLPRR
jgi:hypothetical protein